MFGLNRYIDVVLRSLCTYKVYYLIEYKSVAWAVVVSMLSFFSNNPSLNPTKVFNVSVKILLKRTKIIKNSLA